MTRDAPDRVGEAALADEIAELRARLDANDHILVEMLAWLFTDFPPDVRRALFVEGLQGVADMISRPAASDADALRKPTRTVLMQVALQRQIAGYRTFLDEPPARPRGSGRQQDCSTASPTGEPTRSLRRARAAARRAMLRCGAVERRGDETAAG